MKLEMLRRPLPDVIRKQAWAVHKAAERAISDSVQQSVARAICPCVKGNVITDDGLQMAIYQVMLCVPNETKEGGGGDENV